MKRQIYQTIINKLDDKVKTKFKSVSKQFLEIVSQETKSGTNDKVASLFA